MKNILFLLFLFLISCKNEDTLFVDSLMVLHTDSSCEKAVKTCVYIEEEIVSDLYSCCGVCVSKKRKTEIDEGISQRLSMKQQSEKIQRLHNFLRLEFNDIPDDIYVFMDRINSNEKARNKLYDVLHTKEGGVRSAELRGMFAVKREDFKDLLLRCESSYKLMYDSK